jgi:hypothetical protein
MASRPARDSHLGLEHTATKVLSVAAPNTRQRLRASALCSLLAVLRVILNPREPCLLEGQPKPQLAYSCALKQFHAQYRLMVEYTALGRPPRPKFGFLGNSRRSSRLSLERHFSINDQSTRLGHSTSRELSGSIWPRCLHCRSPRART